MSPSQVYNAIGKARNSNRSVFLWGPPGISKSETSKQYATDHNLAFVDIRLSQLDPTDLRGIPYPVSENNVTGVRWSAPLMLPQNLNTSKVFEVKYPETTIMDFTLANPKGSNGIHYVKTPHFELKSFTPNATAKIINSTPTSVEFGLYDNDGNLTTGNVRVTITGEAEAIVGLEEFNSAPPSIQAGSYQLILDKMLGEYISPKGIYWMAMGNRDTDRGITFKMGSAISNRFVHIEMHHSFDDWQKWALTNYIHPHVVAYISTFEDKFFESNPDTASRDFPTLMAWHLVSDILYNTKFCGEEDFAIMSGLVTDAIGDAVGMKIMAFHEVARGLPEVSQIISGRITKLELTSDQMNAKTQIMIALTTSMLYELKECENKLRRGFPNNKHLSEMGARGDELYMLCDNFLGFMITNFSPEITLMGVRAYSMTYRLPIEFDKIKNFRVIAEKYGSLILKMYE